MQNRNPLTDSKLKSATHIKVILYAEFKVLFINISSRVMQSLINITLVLFISFVDDTRYVGYVYAIIGGTPERQCWSFYNHHDPPCNKLALVIPCATNTWPTCLSKLRPNLCYDIIYASQFVYR